MILTAGDMIVKPDPRLRYTIRYFNTHFFLFWLVGLFLSKKKRRKKANLIWSIFLSGPELPTPMWIIGRSFQKLENLQ